VLLIYLVCVAFSAMGLVVFFQKGKGLALSLGVMFTLGLAAMWVLRYFRNLNPWEQFRDAVIVRERTARFVELCRDWTMKIERGEVDQGFPARFWCDIESQGFCYFAMSEASGKRQVFGVEPSEGNFFKIKIPVLREQKTVAVLEFGVCDAGQLDPRVWERYAAIARNVLAVWINSRV